MYIRVPVKALKLSIPEFGHVCYDIIENLLTLWYGHTLIETSKASPYLNHLHMLSLCTQFCDDVVMGMFPVSQEKLLKLAALRLQYLDGDCTPGSTMYAHIHVPTCAYYALFLLAVIFMHYQRVGRLSM